MTAQRIDARPPNQLPIEVLAASLSGFVLDMEGEPLPESEVLLRHANGRPQVVAAARADARGRFSFQNLSASEYVLSASRPGYVTSDYGATRRGRPGTPVVLSAGSAVEMLQIRLPRAAVIGGIIRRLDGSHLAGGSVVISESRIDADGHPTLLPMATVRIDDRGLYRAAGLPSGRYVVRADPPQMASNDDGFAWAGTYWPGVPDAEDAGWVALGPGEERTGVDFTVTMVRTAEVAGRVLVSTAHGALAATNVTLRRVSRGRVSAAAPARTAGERFSFEGVHPGEYLLHVALPSSPRSDAEAAQLHLVVAGSDLPDLVLVPRLAASVRGRVVFKGDGRPPDWADVRVRLTPVGDAGLFAGVPSSTTVHDDGTFVASHIVSGTYRIDARVVVSDPKTAIRAESAVHANRNVADAGIEIREGQLLSDVTIVLTGRLGGVAGRLQHDDGRPASQYTVIAFPQDSALWPGLGRWIAATRPLHSGEFRMPSLLPGRYYLAVSLDPEPNQWLVPAFLRTLMPHATAIEVVSGATTIHNLTVAQ